MVPRIPASRYVKQQKSLYHITAIFSQITVIFLTAGLLVFSAFRRLVREVPMYWEHASLSLKMHQSETPRAEQVMRPFLINKYFLIQLQNTLAYMCLVNTSRIFY